MPAFSPHTEPTLNSLRELLLQRGGEEARRVAANPKLLKAVFDLLKSLPKGDWAGAVSATASGVSAGSKAYGAGPSTQQSARMTAFTLATLRASYNMVQVTKLSSPTAVAAFVSATLIQKTGLALGLAGDDQERARCVGALMELGGNVAVTGLLATTMGPFALTLSGLSLLASAYSAYQVCK